MLVVVPLLLLDDGSQRAWAYAAATVTVALEIAQWAIARHALQRSPSFSERELYESRPLEGDQRRWIGRYLALVLFMVAFLALVFATLDQPGNPLLSTAALIAAGLPGFVALLRIYRHNSWLAATRPIPRAPGGQSAPG